MKAEINTVITDERLDAAAICAAVSNAACGAIASFIGVVRNHDAGDSVTAIDYSAHPQAPEIFRSLAEDLAGEPGVHRIEAWHRIGHLEVGDEAMVVAVAAEHRSQAFRSVEALVEEIKKHLPVWKKQVFADGTHAWSGLP